MPSVHLRAVLFTLAGKEPAKNPYCSVALLWLANVIEVAGLGEADEIGLIMDTATAAHMESSTIFPRLVANAPCPVTVIETGGPPATVLEGMMYKYVQLEFAQDYFMYCDIDCLFTGSLRPVLEAARPETIHAHAEGPLSHAAYGSDLPAGVLARLGPGAPGISAGKFLVTSKPLLAAMFRLVQELSVGRPTYWAVEQPFFNHALLRLSRHVDTGLFAPLFCDSMDKLGAPGTLLLDLNGETGDGAYHLDLMVQGVIMIGLRPAL
jgi:hypothetical protein